MIPPSKPCVTLQSSALEWFDATVRRELRAFERARHRFVEKPNEDRLHDVRTTGRRLRSLLEDGAGLGARPRLLRHVKRASEATDAARDAAVARRLLEAVVDGTERENARALFEVLERRSRTATRAARRYLRRVRLEL